MVDGGSATSTRLRTARGGLLGFVGPVPIHLSRRRLARGRTCSGDYEQDRRRRERPDPPHASIGIGADEARQAAFWWCYMDLEARASPKDPEEMPTDVPIAEFIEQLPKLAKKMKRWGAGALLCNGTACMQAALIAWITIRLGHTFCL